MRVNIHIDPEMARAVQRTAREIREEVERNMANIVRSMLGVTDQINTATTAARDYDEAVDELTQQFNVPASMMNTIPPYQTVIASIGAGRIMAPSMRVLEILQQRPLIQQFMQMGGEIVVSRSPVDYTIRIEAVHRETRVAAAMTFEEIMTVEDEYGDQLFAMHCERVVIYFFEHFVWMGGERPAVQGHNDAAIRDVRVYDRALNNEEMDALRATEEDQENYAREHGLPFDGQLVMSPPFQYQRNGNYRIAATQAEWDEARRQHNEQQRLERQRLFEREQAEQRSKEFLFEHLNDEQRKYFQQRDYFTIVAKSGRMYKISPLRSFNVSIFDSKNAPVAFGNLCVQATDDVPIYDQMLMQKLMIETDEDNFIKIANVRGDELQRLQMEIRARDGHKGLFEDAPQHFNCRADFVGVDPATGVEYLPTT